MIFRLFLHRKERADEDDGKERIFVDPYLPELQWGVPLPQKQRMKPAFQHKREKHLSNFLEKEAERNKKKAESDKNLVELNALRGRPKGKVRVQSSGSCSLIPLSLYLQVPLMNAKREVKAFKKALRGSPMTIDDSGEFKRKTNKEVGMILLCEK